MAKSKIGVDELFGGLGAAKKCSLRSVKSGKFWYVDVNGRPVVAGAGFQVRFKRKPTRKQLAKIRREVCG